MTTTFSSRASRLAIVLLASALAVAFTPAARALDPSVQRLTGRWATTPTNFRLGSNYWAHANSLSSKWALVGAPSARDRGAADEGSVQVFNAATGAWVRKLLPPVTSAGAYFGASTMISGDLGIVGAPLHNNNTGAVHVFNLATGALVRTLTASDGGTSGWFGYSLAVIGDILAVGATSANGNKGAVYLYRLSTGAPLATPKLIGNDSASGDEFGSALAAEGGVLAVGAPSFDQTTGAVYLFDLTTSTLIAKHVPAGSSFNFSGRSLAMHQGKLVIGGSGRAWLYDLAHATELALSPAGGPAKSSFFGEKVAIHDGVVVVSDAYAASEAGAVHFFSAHDGAWLNYLSEPNGNSPTHFGQSPVLLGNTLLVAAPAADTLATDDGCAYLIRPLAPQPMPFDKVTAKGDFAPGAGAEVNIGTIGDAFINGGGRVTFSTSFTGTGSNANKDTGIVSEIVNDLPLTLGKSRDGLGAGTSVGSWGKPTSNDDGIVFGLGTRTGTGITTATNAFLWYRQTGAASQAVLQYAGNPMTVFGGATLLSVSELVSSSAVGQRQGAAVCNLRVGLGGTTAASDSGIYAFRITSPTSLGVREGQAAYAVAGALYGQFAPRVSYFEDYISFSTALVDDPNTMGNNITAANNAAIYTRTLTGGTYLMAQKGVTPVGNANGVAVAGQTYSSFLGEGCDGNGYDVFRATIAGTGVTSANNEGLWRFTGSTRPRLLAKGDSIASLPGVKIGRIISFWGCGNVNGVLALVSLVGTGVNTSNDVAFIHAQSNQQINVLLREGDAAPGCHPARVGVISRVECESKKGYYAVIVSLTGATTGTELALFTGCAARGDNAAQQALRRPFLNMRKGQLFDNQPSKVKSFYLPTTNVNAGGAGSTGRGRAISRAGDISIVVEFDNTMRQVMAGAID